MPQVISWNQYPGASDMTNWKKTTKKLYEVYVCMPALGTKVYNVLEDAYYTTTEERPFVLSGTVGEQWIIDFARLARTYKQLNGEPITIESFKGKGHPYKVDWFKIQTVDDPTTNWAFFVDKSKKVKVQTAWGDSLIANRSGIEHGFGDYLVCTDVCGYPNMKDMWIVNGAVFSRTYNMKAFPGKMINWSGKIPIPKTLIK